MLCYFQFRPPLDHSVLFAIFVFVYMYNHCIPCYGWKWSISAQIAFVHDQCPHSVLITWLFIMGMFATCFCGSHAPRLSRPEFLIACSTQKWRRFDVSDVDHMIKRLGPFSLCCEGSKARAWGLGLYCVILWSVCEKKFDRSAEVTWSKHFPNLSLHLHLLVLVVSQYNVLWARV